MKKTDRTKIALSLILAMIMLIGMLVPSFADTRFTDVKNNAYYFDAVEWAVDKGITNGTSETTFSPNNVCTRAQIVTFLYRFDGSTPVTASVPFEDVKPTDYYSTAVQWANEKGLTKGKTETTFGPNDPCTKAQAVVFLYRHASSPIFL